jgi:hypothetical protein
MSRDTAAAPSCYQRPATAGPLKDRARPWPVLAVAAILALTVALLRIEGRRWWCACGRPGLWVSDVWTSHCSQHLFDPYSITHVSHGLILYPLLSWLRPHWSAAWKLAAIIAIAAGWEVLENSPLIINRYRAATMSLDYLGDSIANSLGDILSCVVGCFVARRVGVLRSGLVFIGTELLLLVLMRDNLTLNVVMLVHPVPAIKAWQSVGHASP